MRHETASKLDLAKTVLVSLSLTMLVACQAASSRQSPPEPVSAGALTKEYQASTTDARRKYDGREITVKGLAQMAAMMPPSGEEQGLVFLEEKGTNPPRRVACWFSNDQADQFSQIKGGQFIIVKGIFNGESGAELKFCKLVKIESASQQVNLRGNSTEELKFKINKESSPLIAGLLRNESRPRVETVTNTGGNARPEEARTSSGTLVHERDVWSGELLTQQAAGPLSGVEVSMSSKSAQTNRDGDYSLAVASERYSLSARLRGYVTATLTITVPSAEMRQDIALKPERAAVRPGPITRTPVSVGAVEVGKVNLEGQIVGPSGSPVVGTRCRLARAALVQIAWEGSSSVTGDRDLSNHHHRRGLLNIELL